MASRAKSSFPPPPPPTTGEPGGRVRARGSERPVEVEEAYPAQLVRLHRNCLVPAPRLLGLRTLADGRVLARLAGTDFSPEVSRRNLPAVRKLLRAG